MIGKFVFSQKVTAPEVLNSAHFALSCLGVGNDLSTIEEAVGTRRQTVETPLGF